MEGFENGGDMSGFRSLNNSTSKRVLNLLEPVKLTVWKVMIERVTVVKFRVNYGGGNGAGCFEVKVRADTAKFTNVIVSILRKCSDLIREGSYNQSTYSYLHNLISLQPPRSTRS